MDVAGAEAASVLAKLERRFAAFRKEHAMGTRVPEELRAAVLTALSEGVKVSALRRKCGLSSIQVAGWEASRTGASVGGRQETAKVRAFSIVKDEAVGRPAPPLVPEDALELRLGRWSVSVRLAGQTAVERG